MGAASLLLAGVDAGSGYGRLWWPLAIMGAGTGITFASPSAAGLRAIAVRQAGEASGIINVVRYLAAALVVAIGTVAFTEVGADDLNRRLDATRVVRLEDATLDRTLTGGPGQLRAAEAGLDPRDRTAFRTAAGEGTVGGFGAVMLGLGLLALGATVPWIALIRPGRGP
ncbi:MAG: hypothetical protein GEU88_14750 [Solirubrobacterales bacterium]|nr:hypothetical protein [Solirubrobacterales bacterium]